MVTSLILDQPKTEAESDTWRRLRFRKRFLFQTHPILPISNLVLFRFSHLLFRILSVPPLTVPQTFGSATYCSAYFRFRLLRFRIISVPPLTVPHTFGFATYCSAYVRFRHLRVPKYVRFSHLRFHILSVQPLTVPHTFGSATYGSTYFRFCLLRFLILSVHGLTWRWVSEYVVTSLVSGNQSHRSQKQPPPGDGPLTQHALHGGRRLR